MKALMPDLAKDGITINLVLPGRFLTSRISPGLDESGPADPDLEARLEPLAQTIPVGRLGQPIELGDLVAFLASQRKLPAMVVPARPTRSTAASLPRMSSPAAGRQSASLQSAPPSAAPGRIGLDCHCGCRRRR